MAGQCNCRQSWDTAEENVFHLVGDGEALMGSKELIRCKLPFGSRSLRQADQCRWVVYCLDVLSLGTGAVDGQAKRKRHEEPFTRGGPWHSSGTNLQGGDTRSNRVGGTDRRWGKNKKKGLRTESSILSDWAECLICFRNSWETSREKGWSQLWPRRK